MNSNSKLIKLANLFFLFTFSILLVLFLRWLLVAPFIFENILDFALLLFYGILIAIFGAMKARPMARLAVFPLTILLFIANCWCLLAYSPIINDAAICNGNIYFISHYSPFGDMQWTDYRYTKWSGLLHYETWFFGYEYGPYKIICDSEQNETNIIRDIYDPGILVYIDGKQNIQFDRYLRAHTHTNLYFLSQRFNNCDNRTCENITYTLYECDLGYKACHPLSIEYTDIHENRSYLKADDITGEITLYTVDDKIIFTYSEHPRCYVEGCEILQQ